MKIDKGDSSNQIIFFKYKEENTDWDERWRKNEIDNHNKRVK